MLSGLNSQTVVGPKWTDLITVRRGLLPKMVMISTLKPYLTGGGGFGNAAMSEQWQGSLSIER
jgi:hypothetical protein